jgi:hypothetical protein
MVPLHRFVQPCAFPSFQTSLHVFLGRAQEAALHAEAIIAQTRPKEVQEAHTAGRHLEHLQLKRASRPSLFRLLGRRYRHLDSSRRGPSKFIPARTPKHSDT